MSIWPQLAGLSTGPIQDGKFTFALGQESVRETLLHILLTVPGERLMRPDFGAGVLGFIHRPNNATTRNLLAATVAKAVEQWEPRIELEGVTADADLDNPTLVHLKICYRLPRDPQLVEFELNLELEPA